MTNDTSTLRRHLPPLAPRPPARGRRSRRRRPRLIALLVAVVLAAAAWQVSRPLEARLDLAAFTGLGDGASTMTELEPEPEPEPDPETGEAATPATGLDPELQRRFDVAQAAAAAEGVELTLTSGWRSADEQQRLVDEALVKYGSTEEAHRWVLPPETSPHVTGLAIDVGGTEGAYWLTEHGPEYGLCRTYANEVWHFEPLAAGTTDCPEMLEDALWGW